LYTVNNILFSKILYLDYPLWLSGIGDKNSILHSLQLCSIGWMSNKKPWVIMHNGIMIFICMSLHDTKNVSMLSCSMLFFVWIFLTLWRLIIAWRSFKFNGVYYCITKNEWMSMDGKSSLDLCFVKVMGIRYLLVPLNSR